jgi:hypothetical protein
VLIYSAVRADCLYTADYASSLKDYWPVLEADYSPVSTDEVKNEWS